jgi:hypothetical protein
MDNKICVRGGCYHELTSNGESPGLNAGSETRRYTGSGSRPLSSVVLIVVLLGASYSVCARVSRKKVVLPFYSSRVGLYSGTCILLERARLVALGWRM